MTMLAELLIGLIAEFGLDYVLQFLVNAGILPPSVLLQGQNALEHEQYLIEQLVQQTDVAVQHPSYGLNAIKTQVDRNAVDVTKLVAAINALSVQVSNLPTPPGEDSIAAQVWGYPNTGQDISAYDHLLYIERFAANLGYLASFTLQADPFLVVETSWKYPPD